MKKRIISDKLCVCVGFLLLACILLLCLLRKSRESGPIQGIVVSVTDHALILQPREDQEISDLSDEIMVYTDLLQDDKSKVLIRVLKEGDCVAFWYNDQIWFHGKKARVFRPLRIIRVKFAVYGTENDVVPGTNEIENIISALENQAELEEIEDKRSDSISGKAAFLQEEFRAIFDVIVYKDGSLIAVVNNEERNYSVQEAEEKLKLFAEENEYLLSVIDKGNWMFCVLGTNEMRKVVLTDMVFTACEGGFSRPSD